MLFPRPAVALGGPVQTTDVNDLTVPLNKLAIGPYRGL